MTLILHPDGIPKKKLRGIVENLRTELEATLETVRHPPDQVLDPASLETAEALLRATLAALDRPGPREPRALALDANLAYATLNAVVDLVKSHTAMPKVPIDRKSKPARD
ncbi:MAG TPA: hypothetical protein VEK13_07040 [Thermoplasmata archaeon]|nr:hypothetical protein [Thermoplasmata archaeon]